MKRGQGTRNCELDRFTSSRGINLNLEFWQFIKDNVGVIGITGAEHHISIVLRKLAALRPSCSFEALPSFGYWVTGDRQRVEAAVSS